MEHKPGIKLPPVDQIGIVVRDIDETVRYYETVFNLGPFQTREVEMTGFSYKDQPGYCRLKLAMAQSGPIEIELIQVLEGETPHSEFIKQNGEGLQHLRFPVKDLSNALVELAKAGVKPVFQHSLPQVDFAYVHSESMGNVQFELIEYKDSPAG